MANNEVFFYVCHNKGGLITQRRKKEIMGSTCKCALRRVGKEKSSLFSLPYHCGSHGDTWSLF